MPSATMPPGGGIQQGGLWYTPAEWQAHNGLPTNGTANNGGTGLSAQALISSILDPMGLSQLSSWAWSQYNQAGGGQGGLDYINATLPQQQAFKERFPEYAITAARGNAWSPAQILAAEQQTAQQLQAAGLSGLPGYDPRTVTAANVEGNVSSSEFQSRLDARMAAAAQYHPGVSQQLKMLGIDGDAALTAYVTDPDVALPMIQQQVAAAQAAAAGVASGFGQIDAATATHLAQQGVTQSQAQSTFGQLGQLQQLGNALPGESGNGITQNQFIGAGFENNAQDAAAIAAEQGRRAAAFQQKGAYAAGQAGISGVGSAAN